MKVLCFTDIHFGKRQNSRDHNEAALLTVDEIIRICMSRGIRHVVFLGDWHDSRTTLDVSTLNFSHAALTALNDFLDGVDGKMFFIIGNHDLYYRNTRDIHSIPFVNEFDNIELVEHPKTVSIENTPILMLPWLGEEDDVDKILKETNARIIMGHQEWSGFRWNPKSFALTEGLNPSLVAKFDLVLSGHYHLRQQQGNIHYIGSCMQHDFGDVGSERGYMIINLDDLQSIEFIENDVAPRFVELNVEDALRNLNLLRDNHVKLIETRPIDPELQEVILEKVAAIHPARLIYQPCQADIVDEEFEDDEKLETMEVLKQMIEEQHKSPERVLKLIKEFIG